MAQMGADIHGGIPPKDLFLSAYICVISGHSSHAEMLKSDDGVRMTFYLPLSAPPVDGGWADFVPVNSQAISALARNLHNALFARLS